MNSIIYCCVTVWLLCLFDICNCTSVLSLSNVTRIKRASKKCTLPDYPNHGKWELTKQSASPGEEVSVNTVVKYSCHNGYKLSSNSPYVICDDTWNVNLLPTCLKLCPPLRSTTTTILKCINAASEEVSCAEATHGTYLTYTCAAYYEVPRGFRQSLTCKSGKWNSEPVCQSVCGRTVSDAKKLAFGATELKGIEYPWIAAIYHPKISGNFTICGGSIISRKVILTAAHCITNDHGDVYNAEEFKVGVGKLYNQFQDARDIYAEYYEVKKLIKYSKYIGETNLFTGDIAIIVIKKLLNWGPFVQPVCITNIESIHLTERAVGEIAGWGKKEDGEPSDQLRFLKIPYKEQAKCAAEFPLEWERKYNIEDKLCAGFLGQNKSVCGGDSGSGLVFRNIDDNRFYVHGVVSLAPTLNGGCNFQQNSLYTRVSSYYMFIDQETTRYYEEECVLPKYPTNGVYNVVEGGIDKQPGDIVSSSSVLTVRCNEGFVLEPPVPTVECENVAFMPRCLLSCPLPDLQNTASHQCINHEGDVVDCSKAVTGTLLKFKCANGYSPISGSSEIRSCRNGAWGTPNPGCEVSLYSVQTTDVEDEGDGVKVICTYASWASHKGINPQDFDANLCTHVYYAFAGLTITGDVRIADDTLDVHEGLYRNVTSMKYRNPNLKVLLSIGGSRSTNNTLWSNLVASEGRISAFIGSASYFMRTYNFDGVNIDWNYPEERDKDNYINFLLKVRQAFLKERWLLTASVRSDFEGTGYDVIRMNATLNWVVIKTYDFYGHWGKYTGEHTALHSSPYETPWEKKHLNVDAVVKNWLEAGLDKKKLVISVAFYARTFKLKNKNNHDVHAPIQGSGPGEGILEYSEICSKYDHWSTVWNEEQKTTYKFKNDEWFSYDSPEAIKLKAQYVIEEALLGVNVWSIDADDIFRKCGKKQVLLKTLHEGLGHKVIWDN